MNGITYTLNTFHAHVRRLHVPQGRRKEAGNALGNERGEEATSWPAFPDGEAAAISHFMMESKEDQNEANNEHG